MYLIDVREEQMGLGRCGVGWGPERLHFMVEHVSMRCYSCRYGNGESILVDDRVTRGHELRG